MNKDTEEHVSWNAEMVAVVHRLVWRTALHALSDEFGRRWATRFSRVAGHGLPGLSNL